MLMPSGIVTKLFGAATASGPGIAVTPPATTPSATRTDSAIRLSRDRARVTDVSLSAMAPDLPAPRRADPQPNLNDAARRAGQVVSSSTGRFPISTERGFGGATALRRSLRA